MLKLLLDTNYDMNEQLKAEAEEKRRAEEESRKKLALTRKPSRRQFGLGETLTGCWPVVFAGSLFDILVHVVCCIRLASICCIRLAILPLGLYEM